MSDNPRKAGVQRILAKDDMTLQPGELPGVGVVLKVGFADPTTGAECEVYLTMLGALNLGAALQRHVAEQTGVVAANGVHKLGGGGK